ncbi:MAG: Ribosomal RNA small subunit methyltransferase H [Fimbriimonadaceae bacterium]|nr:Ribosomal RNA small subunit methyltransferase H [Fimbriimonadaceae bacterium]
MTHESVMVEEVLDHLKLRAGQTVVDGTLGLAGHSLRMAEAIKPGGLLLGMDWDEAMLAEARTRLEAISGVEIELVNADYRELPSALAKACSSHNRAARADGILLDLGLNNAQIEDPVRGISFRSDAPLDMRMDRSSGEPASSWINRASAREIEDVLWNFGDERWARKIAQVITERRKANPIHTTSELVDCVQAAVPAAKRDKRIHPATRTFQAIRIYINRELEGLQEALEEIARCLAQHGRMVVLAYHSGEDRAVKRAFRKLSGEGFLELTPKPLVPSDSEVQRNPKSRSAKLRAIERIREETP